MEQEKSRKGGNQRGVRTQKMMTFRIDNENAAWLEQQPNKGRTVNDLIATARLRE